MVDHVERVNGRYSSACLEFGLDLGLACDAEQVDVLAVVARKENSVQRRVVGVQTYEGGMW